jgi:hypothetical protein
MKSWPRSIGLIFLVFRDGGSTWAKIASPGLPKAPLGKIDGGAKWNDVSKNVTGMPAWVWSPGLSRRISAAAPRTRPSIIT